jgi:hypothetical protein
VRGRGIRLRAGAIHPTGEKWFTNSVLNAELNHHIHRRLN